MSFDLAALVKAHGKKPSEQGVPQFIALFSRPGGGKTWLAASISEVPGVKKTLYIDTEGSTKGTLTSFDDSKITILPVTNLKSFNMIFKSLIEDEHDYDAVVIDTLDVVQGWAVDHFLAAAKDGFKAWGEVKKWTNDIGTNLQNANFKSVVCFHEVADKLDNGTIYRTLKLVGSAKDDWPGLPQVVVWLERKLATVEGKDGEETEVATTFAHFESSDNKVTKNRYNIPAVVQNPDFKSLFAYIEKSQKNTKPKETK